MKWICHQQSAKWYLLCTVTIDLRNRILAIGTDKQMIHQSARKLRFAFQSDHHSFEFLEFPATHFSSQFYYFALIFHILNSGKIGKN